MSVEFIPFDYQDLIVDQCLANDEAMVFASPGLGKSSATLKALDTRFAKGEVGAAIIVAPLRVAKLTWPAEIRKWSFSSGYRICDLRQALVKPKNKKEKVRCDAERKKWDDGSADIYVVNYDMLIKMVKELIAGREHIHPNAIVFDEIHNAKNPSSKRIAKMRTVMKHFRYRIGLTGTPQPNGYMDLFGQFRLIDGGARLDNRITYYRREYFFNPDGQGFKWELRKGARGEIENLISDITVTLTAEEYGDVPEIEFDDIEVEIPKKLRKKYDELEKEFLTTIAGGDVPAVSAAALGNKLLQLASGSVYDEDGIVRPLHDVKVKALQKLVAQRQRAKETILIVCFYNHEMDRICEALPEARKFNEDDVDEWNEGRIPVWVAKYTSIMEGLNLQYGGHHICWFVPTYSHMYFTQLNARLARTGQEHRTVIHRILAKDTADEAAVEALRSKNNGEQGFMKSLQLLEASR